MSDRQSVLFVVAHPDDLVYGMGGLVLFLRDTFDLHLVCATKGERGVAGKGLSEAAAIREKEQKMTSELFGAHLTFLGRIDRELYADIETCQLVADIIQETAPVAVFTLWPVDSHPDHSAVSEVVRKALFITQSPAEIVYCEEGDDQTARFAPTVYVDISQIMEKKLEILRCHKSQNRNDALVEACLRIAELRGAQAGCTYAEGYVSLADASDHSVFSSLEQTVGIIKKF